ncbi:hypothetical protein [Pseudacidovorax sp. NFM-22]|uniref:hypothetical protein n=1 Tax=Pseudacidovorax sp. NFM-22 TaxID=2744469 RepID=UPI001F182E0D|nr:hypothetical protein [Pseudacidovorax sp. NFM-22]
MALYELSDNRLAEIAQASFTQLGVRERENIQRALRLRIEAITPGVRTMVLAEEFSDWVDANRRIDLLCLDDQARLVVVELKRDASVHMELQAIRYAAMVSAMRFEQAVEAHRKYLRANGSTDDPETQIRLFLEQPDGAVALSNEVRIVLAAADFTAEVTTTVLWLNKQGLDIRCIQMRPYGVEDRVFLDIQQIIPLPAAEQYQVALREKTQEQVAADRQTRDTTRYDLSIGDVIYPNLPKRRLVFMIVREALKRGISPPHVAQAVPWREDALFASAAGELEAEQLEQASGKSRERYFMGEGELFFKDGRTYAISNQWGHRTHEALDAIVALLPPGEEVSYEPVVGAELEAEIRGFVIRRLPSGTIEVERDGVVIEPARPVLRQLASELGVSTVNGQGKDLNTRQLGAKILKAIGSS